MEVLRNEYPKANKDHICEFCGETIKKGDVYNSQTNIYDGVLYTWKCHKDCLSLVHELEMNNHADDNGITQDIFQECVCEAYDALLSDEEREDDESSWKEQLKVVKNHYYKKED